MKSITLAIVLSALTIVACGKKDDGEATSGQWSMTACPTDKQFANCATSESKIFYYAGTQARDAVIQVDEDFAKKK